MIAAVLAAVAVVLPPVPGAYNHQVTRVTVARTVCVAGWSAQARPPEAATGAYKRLLLAGRPAGAYQLDHLVSLSLGGAGTVRDFAGGVPNAAARRNLWLQPVVQARADDRLEALWHRELCAGEMTLRQVRRAEVTWKRAQG